jgi:hypothetical protein
VKIIKLNELENEKALLQENTNPTKKIKLRIKEIEEEMKPLQSFLNNAQLQRNQIKLEIGMIAYLFKLDDFLTFFRKPQNKFSEVCYCGRFYKIWNGWWGECALFCSCCSI